MLSGKRYPPNVRALTMFVEKLLRPVFENHNVASMEDLQTQLGYLAKRCRTSKLWIDCVINPVLLMLRYIRAERESDWVLHLSSVEEMLPYFFCCKSLQLCKVCVSLCAGNAHAA